MVAYGVPILWAFIVAVLIGAAKEARDKLGYGTPDVWDFVATAVGAAIVLPVLIVGGMT
tara:strand:- start:108 stop:284 length:177 start_codon:yes stop_codon:yes gene_type:complete